LRAEIEDFLAHPSTTRGCGPRPRPGRTEGQELALEPGQVTARRRPPDQASTIWVRWFGRAALLADWPVATRCWSPRVRAGMGTVRMSFAIASPGVVYLLTSASRARRRAGTRRPLGGLTAPGSRLAAEAVFSG